MSKTTKILAVLMLTLLLVPAAQATNGTNLIGIGPISRAMGGGGVAAPQDAISAVFANPAAVCFGPFCPGSSVDFAGTYFDPTVNGKIENFGIPGSLEGESKLNPFMVPAIAVSMPINPRWRFGIGMFGVSGLGADYKGTNIYPTQGVTPPNGWPVYTQLQTMKFAPNLAWLITDNFSVGASLEIVWQNLDLGQGSSHGYTAGLQLGALYKVGQFQIGGSYTTPESVEHKNVANLDPQTGGTWDNLKIESPQSFKLGVAWVPGTTWLVEFNTKWYGWGSADGYGDFGWDDQWVFGIGGQWRPIDKWAFRLGYNYGETPIKKNNGFSLNPAATTPVQGKNVPTGFYEVLRIVGFPALAEQHFTAGIGYDITENFILNLSLMYSPEETFTETSGPVTIEASLKEWSTTFGLTWYF
jgi:long-chain fatty acid transport protein